MKVLQEQWLSIDGMPLIDRANEREQLVKSCQRPGSISEVIGQGGLGKTTLVKSVSLELQKRHGIPTSAFFGSHAFQLSSALEEIAGDFRRSEKHNLLVVDQADLLDRSDILESINRLATGPWTFATLLVSRANLGIGHRVMTLAPLNAEQFGDFLEEALRRRVDPIQADQLWQATGGNPAFAAEIVRRWAAGGDVDFEILRQAFAPVQAAGILGPDGRPARAGSHEEIKLITDVRDVNEELLKQVRLNPNLVFEMPPRRFEELVAELLSRGGYQVTLTSATRDGGKDMYAARRDMFGSFLFLVECKRYAPDNPVGVEVIRSLHGVAQHDRATAAMVMTTSYFTGPAKEFARDIQYQMSLKDYADLREWIKTYTEFGFT